MITTPWSIPPKPENIAVNFNAEDSVMGVPPDVSGKLVGKMDGVV